MPKITITAWRRRIEGYCAEHQIYRSTRQIKNLASRVALRAAQMHYVDPDDLIRSTLTYSDPTGDIASHELDHPEQTTGVYISTNWRVRYRPQR